MRTSKSKKMQDKTTQYTVYWMHDTSETDINTQGYVGVTKQTLKQRFAKHMYDATVNERNKKVSVYLREAKDVVIEEILVGNYEACLLEEVKLRPSINIGQNTYGGGTKGKATTDTEFTAPNTEYFKKLQKIGTDKYFNKVREIAKERGISFKEARAIYSETNLNPVERRVIAVRNIAKELGISYSEAREVFKIRRDEEFLSKNSKS